MTLSAGSRLGPYEIVSPLGAGGMGEVYRAKDPRLGREVAVKVLPASFSKDPDRLRRFEHEARAAGLLNHPNITSVFDIGSHDGAPYVVTELLEGETLRSRLATGALSTRKALDYAIQIARGLAAAHEKGIVHRDLKPENLFVTKDGRIKILDFGLAKLKQLESGEELKTDIPTGTVGTEPGVVLGTMGYMSPEQVRGKPADYRSDLFAFGAILFEMLSGQRAFRGDTAADTMSAILTKEPPDLSTTNRDIHPGLDRIVRHCLEKNPEERFHSAHDLAFDLEALSGVSAAGAIAAEPAARKRLRLLPVLVPLAFVLGAVAALLAGRRLWQREPPSFHQLTFRRGEILSARFAPDGQTILYSAAWEGKPVEVFQSRRERPESRPFGLLGVDVLGISRSGEIAVSLNRHPSGPFLRSGMLAQMGVSGGGAPREILDDVQWADWGPDNARLAVVREVRGRTHLEFPIGTKLYETGGWISHPRVSPKGDLVAFIDHPALGDDGGTVVTVDRAGKTRTISELFATNQGLAWSAGGDEVLFTAAPFGFNRGVYAATLAGRQRLLSRVTGNLTLQDVSHDGLVLLSHDVLRSGALAGVAGDARERDLSWLDWSNVGGLSGDGKTVLINESGEGGGPGYSVYARNVDGSPAVRLGEGNGQAFSPDGKWALAIVRTASDPQFVLLPVGPGEPRFLSKENVRVRAAAFLPDGDRIVFGASEPGHGERIFVRSLAGGPIRPISPEGYRGQYRTVSPDGRFILARGPDGKTYLYPIGGGEPSAVPGLGPLDLATSWGQDGKLLVYKRGELPLRVNLLDVRTGEKELWKTLIPGDASGVQGITPVLTTPDRRTYAYTYTRVLSDLYLVDGLK
ncbi:MAG TPA: protein kinase [Thermoanaerobaculia bacterium]|nr:protein kinase [Thermoanaerobaculia bacterium]